MRDTSPLGICQRERYKKNERLEVEGSLAFEEPSKSERAGIPNEKGLGTWKSEGRKDSRTGRRPAGERTLSHRFHQTGKRGRKPNENVRPTKRGSEKKKQKNDLVEEGTRLSENCWVKRTLGENQKKKEKSQSAKKKPNRRRGPAMLGTVLIGPSLSLNQASKRSFNVHNSLGMRRTGEKNL